MIRTVGWEGLVVGVIHWLLTIVNSIRSIQRSNAQYRSSAGITAGGILLIAHNDTGMKWIAAAFILSNIIAINETWVILVEIAR